ncbi:cation diffusion facilitator family transporter [Sulfurihydrogenibium sp.]|uniref:cation diffusion facilitator family transporter n=1 Tax=Sulfurihydrogenibium sp. TaxID=2053621 RepID=UPI00262AB890|nr:cation diffusion facilitator family transporter [Sulfurihydrogenibium sp.]
MVYKENVLKERETHDKKTKLYIAIFLNLSIVFLQILFGIYSNSVSLITDAVHNFQDVLSLVVALVAINVISKKPTLEMTYGFLKAEVMAGFINNLVLLFTLIFILYEATVRLIYPEEVKGLYVIVFGFLAFLINLFSAIILKVHHHHEEDHHHHHEDMNIKAAYLHLMSDAVLSLAVVIGGIFIYLFSIYWIDPLLSLIFVIYITKEVLKALKDNYHLLMEGVPKSIDLNKLIEEIEKNFPQIIEIHDLHIWGISSKDIYLSAHIVIDDLNNFIILLEDLEKFLAEKGINHITVQPEKPDRKCNILH